MSDRPEEPDRPQNGLNGFWKMVDINDFAYRQEIRGISRYPECSVKD